MNNTQIPTDENKMNSQYSKLLSHNAKSASAPTTKFPNNPNRVPSNGGSTASLMSGGIMTWTKMLESMDDVSASIDAQSTDTMNTELDTVDSDSSASGDDELLNQLNRIFTPVLIMQGFENDSSDKIKEAMSEAVDMLTEKSLIQFDDDARMAQLISVCAKLIAKQKNTEKWQMYVKAHKIKKQMLLDIQKDEYDAAKALAQKYLVNVSTTNNSPVARNAATALLPATNH